MERKTAEELFATGNIYELMKEGRITKSLARYSFIYMNLNWYISRIQLFAEYIWPEGAESFYDYSYKMISKIKEGDIQKSFPPYYKPLFDLLVEDFSQKLKENKKLIKEAKQRRKKGEWPIMPGSMEF